VFRRLNLEHPKHLQLCLHGWDPETKGTQAKHTILTLSIAPNDSSTLLQS
jgi:hypothetical protein